MGTDTEELPRTTLLGTGMGVLIALMLQYPLLLISTFYSFFSIQLRFLVDRKVISSRLANTSEPPSQ